MSRFIFLLLSVVLVSSCKNLVPYTDALRQKYNWSETEIKRIQFYTSDAIVLQRKIKDGSTEIVAGKIKTINGEKVDEVIIPSGTAGILVSNTSGKFSISFEKDDNYSLSFGSNQHMNNRYSLAFSSLQNKVGKIIYNGKEYYTSPESVDAILMVDLRKIDKTELNQRVAKGRKVK